MRKEVLNETKFIQEIVAVLPIVICFQSLILDMAGNVGTLVPMFFHKRLWHPDRCVDVFDPYDASSGIRNVYGRKI